MKKIVIILSSEPDQLAPKTTPYMKHMDRNAHLGRLKGSFNDYESEDSPYAQREDNTGKEDNEVVDETTSVKYNSLFPQGFVPAGDVDKNDLYPDGDKSVVAGQVSTPSWGSQPLWDIGVRFPIGIFYKRQRAIQEMMLAQAKQPAAKSPEKVEAEKVSAAAPNVMKTNADMFMSRTAKIFEDAEKEYGSPSYAFKSSKYLNRYNKAKADENALAAQSVSAHAEATKNLEESADGKFFLPEEAYAAASKIKNNTNYQFQDELLNSTPSKGKDGDENYNYMVKWYDDNIAKMRKGSTLSSASVRLMNDLDPESRQTFEALTPDEKKKFNNSYALFYKTQKHENVSDARVAELAAQVAQEQGNDFYVTDPNKTDAENKAEFIKSGKIWTDQDLAKMVKNKLGIKDETSPVVVYTKPGTTVNVSTAEKKNSNAIVNSLRGLYQDALETPGKEISLSDGYTMAAGTSDVVFYKGEKEVGRYRNDDWQNIFKDMNEYGSKNNSLYGNVLSSDVRYLFESKEGENSRNQFELVGKDKYKETDQTIAEAEKRSIPNRISYNAERSGGLPIGGGAKIVGSVITGVKDERTEFKVKIKNSDNTTMEGVIVPKTFVKTSDEKWMPYKDKEVNGGSDMVMQGKYVPTKDGLSYNIQFPNGDFMTMGEDGDYVELPQSSVIKSTNPGFENIKKAHSTKGNLLLGTEVKNTSVGAKPIFVQVTKDYDTNTNTFSNPESRAKAKVVYTYRKANGNTKLTDEEIYNYYNTNEGVKKSVDNNMSKVKADDATLYKAINPTK